MSLISSRTLNLSSVPSFVGSVANLVNGGPSTADVYAFGDSLSDAGNDFILSANLLPVSPPYVDGHFTNGPVWVQDMAARLGLPAVQASLGGGSDFAYGGAETGDEPLHSSGFLDLPSQLQQFEAQRPNPFPRGIYTLSAGSNDVEDSISAFATDPNTALANVGAAVNNIANFLFGLAADGARRVVMLNVPDLGKAPKEVAGGPAQVTLASNLSKLFDDDLAATMRVLAREAHINLRIINTYKLVDAAVANPSRFGLSNVTNPVWTGNFTDPNSGTLASTNPAVQNQFLFWDSQHPTAHAHAVLGAIGAHAFGG